MTISKKLKDLPRCSYLDENGKRCKKHSGLELEFHGDGEIHKYPAWVKVNLCVEHYIYYGGSFRPKSKENKGTIALNPQPSNHGYFS